MMRVVAWLIIVACAAVVVLTFPIVCLHGWARRVTNPFGL